MPGGMDENHEKTSKYKLEGLPLEKLLSVCTQYRNIWFDFIYLSCITLTCTWAYVSPPGFYEAQINIYVIVSMCVQ